jgi:type IV pilus assembly protein PilA
VPHARCATAAAVQSSIPPTALPMRPRMFAAAPTRRDSPREGGFALPELLVVILIIGVLAAIAIAVFIGQSGKAKDASAKVQARTAQTAVETYATDHNGEYKGLELAALKKAEPSLSDEAAARLVKAEAKGSAGFVVESESISTKSKYAIERNDGGEVSRSCEVAKKGGCPAGGAW